MYFLFFLSSVDRDHLLNPTTIDRVICAELPQPENDPNGRLIQIVQKIMTHRPYNADFPYAPCMVIKGPGLLLTCFNLFLKPFNPVTTVGENGYPQYRRRDNGQICFVRGRDGRQRRLDNR